MRRVIGGRDPVREKIFDLEEESFCRRSDGEADPAAVAGIQRTPENSGGAEKVDEARRRPRPTPVAAAASFSEQPGWARCGRKLERVAARMEASRHSIGLRVQEFPPPAADFPMKGEKVARGYSGRCSISFACLFPPF
jgi:hypothetical protein